MAIDEVMTEIAGLLQCGSLRLAVTGRPASREHRPAALIGVAGGVRALESATDDDILLAMRNATAIANILRRELPPHWEVFQ